MAIEGKLATTIIFAFDGKFPVERWPGTISDFAAMVLVFDEIPLELILINLVDEKNRERKFY